MALAAERLYVDGHLQIDPALQTKRYIDIRIQGDRLVFVAGKYVGLIPLNDQVAILVRPKVPVENLVEILSVAREEPELLDSLERAYKPDERLNIFDLLVRALHREVKILEARGLHREYVRRQQVSSGVVGRLQIGETILQHWPKADYTHAATTIFEFTRDVLVNRAIAYTLWHIIRTYPLVSDKPDPAILRDLDRASFAFTRVTLDRRRSFLPGLRSLLRDRRIPDSRSYLIRLLTICRVLLDDLGVDIQDPNASELALPPLVVNMEWVFQRYLLNALRDQLPPAGEFACTDASGLNARALFSPPGDRVMVPLNVDVHANAEPDFVLTRDGGPALVADAKYKTDRGRDDVYQVVSHALAYRVRDGVLIYPTRNPKEDASITCIGTVGPVRVYEARYPLDASSLAAAASWLAAELVKLVDVGNVRAFPARVVS